jgi:hypothetical protein
MVDLIVEKVSEEFIAPVFKIKQDQAGNEQMEEAY